MKEEQDYHAKQDFGKAKLSLVPRRIIWDVAAIREYGNNKYPDGGPDNWKSVEPERYRDAAYRHFLGYLDDPRSVDSESGLPHLWHLACNIAFLCEMEDIYLSKNPEVVERLKEDFWTPVTWEGSEDDRVREQVKDFISIVEQTTDYIPEGCKSCSNHPSNGGSGLCNCTIGCPPITCSTVDCPGR